MNFDKKDYTFNDLLDIMRVLRSDDGCPWDKAQTHDSIKYSLLEEACEAMEALDSKSADAFANELGDVLLQVVFHSCLASENGTFTIDNVINHICRKLVFRHSHIFGTDTSKTCDDALDIWEENKKKEKAFSSHTELMRDVCSYLPALMRAKKVQKKAALVGFDWDNVYGALDKLSEETDELCAAIKNNDKENIEEELGDILFSCVNVSRFLNVDAENSLKKATDKFISRFEKLENEVISRGLNLNDLTLAEMDSIWDEIKHK